MTWYDEANRIWKAPTAPYPHSMDMYFGEMLLETLKESPESTLEISHEENYSMTRKEARELTINVAQNLMKLNVRSNDVVGVICRNSKYLPVLIYGCIVVGAPINPLDTSFDSHYIRHIFGQTKPSVVFCDSEVYETTKTILDELENNANIFNLGEKISGVSNITDLIQSAGEKEIFVPPKFVEPSDQKILAIICTSGSSGLPKGTAKTHANFLNFSKMATIPESYRSLNFSPIFWITGFIATLYVPLRPYECKVQTIKLFSPELLVELVEKYKITTVSLSSHHLHVFLNSPLLDKVDFSSVKMLYSGGGIISGQLRQKLRQKFPKTLFMSGYAMTEISVSVLSPGKIYENDASAGDLMTNVAVKIVDDVGNNLGVGEQGEVLVKSLFPFTGYYNTPEATQNAIDSDGFFKTGDLGFFDEDKSIVIVDRKKEIFCYNSYQINPAEIEELILSIDGVAHVSVVGIPDPNVENVTTAAVVKKTGYDALTGQEIVNRVKNHLPFYKQLHGGVVFMDSIPTTASGKVLKRLILEKIQSFRAIS